MRRLQSAVALAGIVTDCCAKRCTPLRPPPLRPPPPLRAVTARGAAGGSKLPPPPPLPGRMSLATSSSWKSPQEVLTQFVEFVPTFFVPINCVASVLDDDSRAMLRGRGKFALFLKKYRFYFDIRTSDTGMMDVKLRDDVNHPKRGAADAKFIMTDVGECRTYTVRPECIVSMEPIEMSQESVTITPNHAPPCVHVRMEERVPVVDRLRTLVPSTLTMLEEVEEKIPEDVLFHPYFDCQGGLQSIATKFPEHFQLIDGLIRLRPPHLAPLSTNDFSFETSPLPDVIKRVQKAVCASDVPQWVSCTSLYETLTAEEKRLIKRDFKSFAGFLRAHGKSLSISNDTLRVSHWIPPRPKQQSASATEPVGTVKSYTQTHVLNELFDKFPRGKTLNLHEIIQLIPLDMRASLPRKVLPWLSQHKNYFVVDNPNEPNGLLAQVRRATETVPLDIATTLYPFIPDEGISVVRLRELLPEGAKELVERLGVDNIVASLPQWLEYVDGDIFRKKSEAELEVAIQSEDSKLMALEEKEMVLDEMPPQWTTPPKFSGATGGVGAP